MILNLGWLGRNCVRNYPLREDAPRLALNTSWELNNRILADVFVVAPELEDGVYVSSVTVTRRIISVTFSSTKDDRALGCASAIYGVDEPFARKPLQALEPGVSGTVTFGTILAADFFEDPGLVTGMHLFPSTSLLEARACLSTGPFPVQGLSINGLPKLNGSVELQTNDQLFITRTDGVEGGEPVTYLTLDLVNPASFLSPCEVPTSPCQCSKIPIQNINGVVGDENGAITIEIVDENGAITLLGTSLLNFRMLRTGNVVCERPPMPDEYGRLPDGTGNYAWDTKPITDYTNPLDESFPNPII